MATEKLEAAGGEGSFAKRIIDSLKFRLGHDPNLGTYVDEKRNIRVLKSEKLATKDPIVKVLYRMIKDEYYDLEITDLDIIP
jgi:hypothetical protein